MVPHGHRKTLTFVAGLRCDGIIAPCALDGPIDAESFLAWVVQFLPPYGPDLNPIEQAFSKLKTPPRKANARTIEQIEKRIAKLTQQTKRAGCLNCSQDAGYAPT